MRVRADYDGEVLTAECGCEFRKVEGSLDLFDGTCCHYHDVWTGWRYDLKGTPYVKWFIRLEHGPLKVIRLAPWGYAYPHTGLGALYDMSRGVDARKLEDALNYPRGFLSGVKEPED